MRNARKWAWLLLGIGVIALGVFSSLKHTQEDVTGPSKGQKTADAESESDAPGLDEGLEEPKVTPRGTVQLPDRRAPVEAPGVRRMPPIEIQRDQSKHSQEQAGEIRDNWRLKSGAGNEPVPDIRNTPPLQMDEPRGLDASRGRREALNDADSEPMPPSEPPPPQNEWEPPPAPPDSEMNGAVPADGFGFEPPPPPPEPEGDFQPEPRDDSDAGGY